jgi:hypothetical protein
MLCRNCGTEIADKALICYRCGTATTDPVRRAPAARTGSGSLFPALVALVALIIAALYLGRATTGDVPPVVPWTVAGLAAVVLVWRIASRRRR